MKSSDPVGMNAARLDEGGAGAWPGRAMARHTLKQQRMKVALIDLVCVFTAPFCASFGVHFEFVPTVV